MIHGGTMNQICVAPDFLLTLLDEVGRTRALQDHETDIIEAIVGRGHRSTNLRVHWTAKMDRDLLTAANDRNERGKIQQFANQHGMTRMAAYRRLQRLKKGVAA